MTAIYLNAMSQVKYKPSNGDVFWIVDDIWLYVWQQKARYIGCWLYLDPGTRKLQEIVQNSKLNKGPDVVLHNGDIDHLLITKLSSTCKFFSYKDDNYVSNGSLIKARIAAGDLEFRHLETFNLLDTNIILRLEKAPFNTVVNATGIDLGTSRCCAAVNRKSGIQTIPLDNTGERLLPSYVAFDEEIAKCGTIVVDRLRNYSKSTVFDSKRIIGRKFGDIEIDQFWPFELFDMKEIVKLGIQKYNERGQVTAEEVSAVLLKQIKEKAEEFQGKKLSDAVITVPAAFTEAQNKATLEAAKLAGWERITLLPESIAAAFAYFLDRPIPNNTNVLLFDFGGGTLDVCIFRIKNDEIQVISDTGDTKLGGRDFDTILINHFKNALITKYGISVKSNKKYLLMIKCQKIKESLSMLQNGSLDIDDFDPAQEGVITINREEFQKMAEPLLNKIRNTIHAALFESKLIPDRINKVFQVGGGSRMPMVKALLNEIFPQAEHCCEEHPDEVVAIGAAYCSAIQQNLDLKEEKKVTEEPSKRLTVFEEANKAAIGAAYYTYSLLSQFFVPNDQK